MKTIQYRATYGGTLVTGTGMTDVTTDEPSEEIIVVKARDINSGFTQALKRTREPLGNGKRRQLSKLEFWQVV